MLSSTHSVSDVKKNLINQPNEYGFKDEDEFNSGIVSAIEKAKMFFMIPAIGETEYDLIAAKDKTGLTNKESVIYNSEIYFSVSIFLEIAGRKEAQRSGGINQSMGKSPDGFDAGKMSMALSFYNDALSLMSTIGYFLSFTYSDSGVNGGWINEFKSNC